LCGSRKCPCPLHLRSLETPRRTGSQKLKYLKEGFMLHWNFQRGGRVRTKKPCMGGVDIFWNTQDF